VPRRRGEAGVVDPADLGSLLEPLGDGLGVLDVALHAQAEGLDALQEVEGVVGGDGGAEVAQHHGARPGDVRRRPEGLVVVEAVVAGVGPGDQGEAPAGRPVEAAAVDDDPADGGAVAADVLGGRVDDHVGTPLEGPAQPGRGEGVVDDERQPGLVGHTGDALDVEHVAAGVADGLAEAGLGLGPDGGPPGVEVVGVVEQRHPDAEAG
jgi:hypothetical protein